MLFEIHAPVGGPLDAASSKLVQLSDSRLDPELSHFAFGRGKLEERAAGV
jgi:hypothetical protein